MLLVPTLSLGIIALFVVLDGFGVPTTVPTMVGTNTIQIPILLPEVALVFPLVLFGFTAFCVMVGLHWSIRSRGTIGSIVASVAVVLTVGGILGLCGVAAGSSIDVSEQQSAKAQSLMLVRSAGSAIDASDQHREKAWAPMLR